MPRAAKTSKADQSLFDITAQLRTAACVPAIRQAVTDWRTAGYPNTTGTTRLLFNHWFNTDHRLKNGRPFAYHQSQRVAIESLVYVWEAEKVWSRKVLLERFAVKEIAQTVPLPKFDDFARYCLKMATGSGKTKVMSLAVAWQFLNAMREKEEIGRDYAKTFLVIAQRVKLPGQFAVIAPKVREWFELHAFGIAVDLNTPEVIKAMGSNMANYVCCDLFVKALAQLAIEEQTPEVLTPSQMLSSLEPFPWSRPVFEANKSVLNVVPCGNEFERAFAKFLDMALDVKAMCKIPESFGFTIEYTDGASNLRNYYPDFVAVDQDGTHWLLETKGAETEEVSFKDRAAMLWCENATKLTGTAWKYLKVKQTAFKQLQPDSLADLAALE
jgi:hypothetical protein